MLVGKIQNKTKRSISSRHAVLAIYIGNNADAILQTVALQSALSLNRAKRNGPSFLRKT